MRTAVIMVALATVLIPVTTAVQLATGSYEEAAVSAVGLGGAFVLLVLIRLGMRSTVIAHVVASCLVVPVLVSATVGTAKLEVPVLGLLATPLVVTLVAGGTHGWVWWAVGELRRGTWCSTTPRSTCRCW